MKWPYAMTAVITGAASGIGRAIALESARRGFKVGVVDMNMDDAGQTLELVKKAGGEGEVFACNVRKLEEVQVMADYFFDNWGEVGLLVNNAGVVSAGYVGYLDMKEWEKVIETDLWGVIYGCHAFLPRMKKQEGGHIVNTSSMSGFIPMAQQAPYNVAKAGVISLSETLKVELAPFNIGVTVLCPMAVSTNILNVDLPDTSGQNAELLKVLFKTAASKAKATSAHVAQKVMEAVENNELYLLPNLSGRLLRLNKRLMPSLFIDLMAYLNKKGLDVRLFMQLAKRGWL